MRKISKLFLIASLVTSIAFGTLVFITTAEAATTGEFTIGGWWQPYIEPTDYNTSQNWSNIAAGNFTTMVGAIASGLDKQKNENSIANSYSNNVNLYVTDGSIYDFQCYTDSDKTALENLIQPYKNDSRVYGIKLKDEPAGFNLEGYANAFKNASNYAPDLKFMVNLNPFLADAAFSNYLHNPPGKLMLSNSKARGSGSYVTSSNALGQIFTIPSGDTFLHGIQLYIDAREWSTDETLTLRVWNSPSKTALYWEGGMTGYSGVNENDYQCFPYFTTNLNVTPGASYFYELTHNGGGDNSVGWVVRSTGDVYSGGAAYENGVSKSYDFWFKLYTKRDNTPDMNIVASGGGDYVTNTTSLGQTFTTPSNVNRRLYYIQPTIDIGTWTSGQALTMTLWDSPSKTAKIASKTLTSSNNGYYPKFYMFAKVASSTSYYWELTNASASQVGWVVRSTSDIYAGGVAYKGGAALSSDFSFDIRFGSEYENHLDDWMIMSESDMLSFDTYPLYTTGDQPEFFTNVEMIRERALDNSAMYGAFVQNTGFSISGAPTRRNPTLNELRYLAYTYLTYGYKHLYWFTYWQPQDPVFSGYAVSSTGTLLTRYYEIQGINSEMKNLSGILKNLVSQEVYHTGSTIPDGTTMIPSNFFVKPASLSQPIIVGYFTNASGRKYVMLMNRDYSNSRNLDFNFNPKSSSMTEISKTTGSEVSVSGYNSSTGVLNITLNPGEGRLFAMPTGY